MIIRHDVDPALYLADPASFTAIAPLLTHSEEIPIAYDRIDEMLKPSLIRAAQTKPKTVAVCDGIGTLIHSQWILTAAHVASDLARGDSITFLDMSYSVKTVVLHPQWQDDETDMAQVSNDIALVQLAQTVENVEPIPLYKDTDERSQIATFVGKGDVGTGLIGPNNVDGKLRKATNRIEKASDKWLLFKFDAPPTGTALEGVSGPGDRGGPALLETDRGWAIAGISSGQEDNPQLGEGYYGAIERYTRVSSYIDWIASVMEMNSIVL